VQLRLGEEEDAAKQRIFFLIKANKWICPFHLFFYKKWISLVVASCGSAVVFGDLGIKYYAHITK
jgi:hypothetical protein